ncbi:MAG: hypothetical protein WCR12_02830 [Dysgonamonadaceae bacterium]
MKKSITIFFLLIMLLVGVQPTLAMHFCGNDLHSVSVLNETLEDSCCAASTSTNSENKQMCELEHDTCCDTQNVELSTDSFDKHLNVSETLPTIDKVWIVLTHILNEDVHGNELVKLRYFPEIGILKQNTNLLTFICIYRI